MAALLGLGAKKLWVKIGENGTPSQVPTKDCDNVDDFKKAIRAEFSRKLGAYDASDMDVYIQGQDKLLTPGQQLSKLPKGVGSNENTALIVIVPEAQQQSTTAGTAFKVAVTYKNAKNSMGIRRYVYNSAFDCIGFSCDDDVKRSIAYTGADLNVEVYFESKANADKFCNMIYGYLELDEGKGYKGLDTSTDIIPSPAPVSSLKRRILFHHYDPDDENDSPYNNTRPSKRSRSSFNSSTVAPVELNSDLWNYQRIEDVDKANLKLINPQQCHIIDRSEFAKNDPKRDDVNNLLALSVQMHAAFDRRGTNNVFGVLFTPIPIAHADNNVCAEYYENARTRVYFRVHFASRDFYNAFACTLKNGSIEHVNNGFPYMITFVDVYDADKFICNLKWKAKKALNHWKENKIACDLQLLGHLDEEVEYAGVAGKV